MLETRIKELTAAVEALTAKMSQDKTCCGKKEPKAETDPTNVEETTFELEPPTPPQASPPVDTSQVAAPPIATHPVAVAAAPVQAAPPTAVAPPVAAAPVMTAGNPLVDSAMQQAAALSAKTGNPAVVMGVAQKHGIADIMTASDESLQVFIAELQQMVAA